VKVAVAGGTGLAGRQVAARLESAGHQPVRLSRGTGVDLTTGAGLDAALAGCDTVVDVTNVRTQRRAAAVRFFGTAATHLRDAAARAGAGHYVLLSIVGIDRIDTGYYAGKRRQEEVLTAAELPWTVLRTTQFHEFAGQILDYVRGPLAPVPSFPTRPVAVAEVADALVAAVDAGPAGYATELAGPEVLRLPDLARRLLRRRGQHRLVVPVRVPGAAGRAYRAGAALPAGEFRAGTTTFADYLR
jgi:uncharacterized protein YbjT (DUF2867 family)